MTPAEIAKIERHLRRTFTNQSISVRARARKDDSAEVYVGEEFIGVVYKDEEDEEPSYDFQMGILAIDLE